TAAEEIQLDFDLSRVVYKADFARWAAKRRWPPPGDPLWRVSGTDDYSAAWPPPKKILFLDRQIQLLARRAGQPGMGARAFLAEWLWLSRYHREMLARYAVRYVHDKRVLTPYPYQDRSSEAA